MHTCCSLSSRLSFLLFVKETLSKYQIDSETAKRNFFINMMAKMFILWIFLVEQIHKIILLKNNLCRETNLHSPPPVNTLFLSTVRICVWFQGRLLKVSLGWELLSLGWVFMLEHMASSFFVIWSQLAESQLLWIWATYVCNTSRQGAFKEWLQYAECL